MLAARHFYELPLDLRIKIALIDERVCLIMSMYDKEFKSWTSKQSSIRIISDSFTKEIYNEHRVVYTLFDVEHNLNGPAILYRDGEYRYLVNGYLHNLDGPAIVGKNKKEYWEYGLRHRLNGPAVIYSNGKLEYWQNGSLYANHKRVFYT
jgi:hypothetical protein